MNMATFLKSAANLLMGVSLAKALAADLGREFRPLIRRSPYRAAGSAAALGLAAGILLGQRRHPRINP